MGKQKSKRNNYIIVIIISILLLAAIAAIVYYYRQPIFASLGLGQPPATNRIDANNENLAINALGKLSIKPTLSNDDYERKLFGSGWADWRGCNTRQKILNRDMKNIKLDKNGCAIISGTLVDPYTGKEINLNSKSAVSKKVQIDHVVALSNAWQTGAKQWDTAKRKQLANDDLELIAVSSSANQAKSDGDASQWLPDNRRFRCQYVARQIAVKIKYKLWITNDEHNAMSKVLATCPSQSLPAQ